MFKDVKCPGGQEELENGVYIPKGLHRLAWRPVSGELKSYGMTRRSCTSWSSPPAGQWSENAGDPAGRRLLRAVSPLRQAGVCWVLGAAVTSHHTLRAGLQHRNSLVTVLEARSCGV